MILNPSYHHSHVQEYPSSCAKALFQNKSLLPIPYTPPKSLLRLISGPTPRNCMALMHPSLILERQRRQLRRLPRHNPTIRRALYMKAFRPLLCRKSSILRRVLGFGLGHTYVLQWRELPTTLRRRNCWERRKWLVAVSFDVGGRPPAAFCALGALHAFHTCAARTLRIVVCLSRFPVVLAVS